MKQFDQGQAVRVTATFRNNSGTLFDPTTVLFTIRRESMTLPAEASESSTDGDGEDRFLFDGGDSSSVDDSIYHTSTGVFYHDVDTSPEGGVYTWRITATDATEPDVAKSGQFYVKPWQDLV